MFILASYWYQNPEWLTALGTIGTAVVSVAALFVAIWAAHEAVNISKEETDISKRLLDLEEKSQAAERFIELSVVADPIGFDRDQIDLPVNPAKWDFVVRSVGKYPVYLKRYILQGDNFNEIKPIGSIIIPPEGIKIYYAQSIPPRNLLKLALEIEDYAGNKYESVYIITFPKSGGLIEITSEKKKPI